MSSANTLGGAEENMCKGKFRVLGNAEGINGDELSGNNGEHNRNGSNTVVEKDENNDDVETIGTSVAIIVRHIGVKRRKEDKQDEHHKKKVRETMNGIKYEKSETTVFMKTFPKRLICLYRVM